GDRVTAKMKRREFVTLLGGAAAWPVAARAQQRERSRRIGVLMGAFAESDREGQIFVAAFREGLQKSGWTEGRNIRIDTRWVAGETEGMQRLAKELVALQPDLIVSANTPHHRCAAPTDPHYPDYFCERCRSGRQRLRGEPVAARRQHHRFHHYGADDGRQVVGAA